MGGRGGSSGLSSFTDAQNTAISRIKKALSKNKHISSQPTFKRNRDGTVEYSYTETRKFAREKGGKIQSATKADTYERTTIFSGTIGKDGLRKEKKPIKTERLLKRGKL